MKMEGIFITLISPGPLIFHLGPISLRWYGLLIAIAVYIGLNLSTYLANLKGIDKSLISDLLPIVVFSSLIGARLYYVVFEWRNYKGNIWEVLSIWNGGIAIHGALIGGTISVLIFSKLRNIKFLELLDVLIPSVALGQAIGRWGNFFNNEAFGIPTNLPWKLFIPLKDRPFIFREFNFFHPTFLYESLWNIAVFSILIILFRKGIQNKSKLTSGKLSCIYLITYSLGRIWIEGLRVDSLCIGGLPPFCEGGLRVAQLISIFGIIFGSIALASITLFNTKNADIEKRNN